MACPPSGSGSYTVVIIPLRTSLHSLDALRFYLWIKRLKDLEMEKDSLWCSVDILEQARLWYHRRLEENRARQAGVEAKTRARSRSETGEEAWSSSLRSRIQRVNGSLGNIMSEPNVTSGSRATSMPDTVVDSDLRWQNTVLAREVGEKNQQIARLELEREALLQQLSELQAH
ncbi:suppressor APC domain-containing protein 1 [Lampris incognitus]|uniref:suppressor APC domain-containing protein 1 n=1 Tax=Lampris incognitus TaxID=2546036 RepID=UPI0024B59D7F|nr:suppressor APC domain-containing protein 1 [Lampris incognitus]